MHPIVCLRKENSFRERWSVHNSGDVGRTHSGKGGVHVPNSGDMVFEENSFKERWSAPNSG